MKTILSNYWETVRTSFWFIPSMMLVIALLMSFNLIGLDRFLDFDSFEYYGIAYSVSPDGARTILSVIAGSVLSVAGVTFSITIVVLNLASSQFGPRLIRNFMKDQTTQAVLGVFVASFLYCLLVLRAVQTTGSEQFVPNLSIIFAILLAVLDSCVLVFFIHHVATAIQADKVISETSKELQYAIKHKFPDELQMNNNGRKREEVEKPEIDELYHYTHRIAAQKSGYVQVIDYHRLIQTAEDNDYQIRLQFRPGQFVATGSHLVIVISENIFDVSLADGIANALVIGDQRTPEEDVEYSIHQLVEVAVRALSPGINDPYTAIACIDQLSAAMCCLATRRFPSAYRRDSQDVIRVITTPTSFTGMLNASFDQIRQYGQTTVSVVIRLLEALTTIAGQSRTVNQRKAIHRQADMVLRSSEKSGFDDNDGQDVRERYLSLLAVLNEFDDMGETYASIIENSSS